MICCEKFLPSEGDKAFVYPIPVSTNNIANYNFTKIYPGEPMRLLRLFTEHEHGWGDTYRSLNTVAVLIKMLSMVS